jgi:hypothetical protein
MKMKNYLALICFTLLLSSCSQQQFTFRKKIAVQHPDKVVVQKHLKKNTDSITNVEANHQITYTKPLSFVKQHEELASESITALPDDTIRKKYKFDEDKKPNHLNSESDPKKGVYDVDSKADKEALTGFILGLVGLFLFQPAAIAGLIYSIRGLKSYKRKGLAIAGVIISGLVILLMLLLLFIIIMLILSFAP